MDHLRSKILSSLTPVCYCFRAKWRRCLFSEYLTPCHGDRALWVSCSSNRHRSCTHRFYKQQNLQFLSWRPSKAQLRDNIAFSKERTLLSFNCGKEARTNGHQPVAPTCLSFVKPSSPAVVDLASLTSLVHYHVLIIPVPASEKKFELSLLASQKYLWRTGLS